MCPCIRVHTIANLKRDTTLHLVVSDDDLVLELKGVNDRDLFDVSQDQVLQPPVSLVGCEKVSGTPFSAP